MAYVSAALAADLAALEPGGILCTDGVELKWVPMPALHTTQSKCECCGSREFRHHHGVRICAYCRSES